MNRNELRQLLEDWAVWKEKDVPGLGYSDETIIYKAMQFGGDIPRVQNKRPFYFYRRQDSLNFVNNMISHLDPLSEVMLNRHYIQRVYRNEDFKETLERINVSRSTYFRRLNVAHNRLLKLIKSYAK